MTHAAIRSQLISTTRHARVVLGHPGDQVGTKPGPRWDQVAGVVRRRWAAVSGQTKRHEIQAVSSLAYEGGE